MLCQKIQHSCKKTEFDADFESVEKLILQKSTMWKISRPSNLFRVNILETRSSSAFFKIPMWNFSQIFFIAVTEAFLQILNPGTQETTQKNRKTCWTKVCLHSILHSSPTNCTVLPLSIKE
jgi:hypothetical protein